MTKKLIMMVVTVALGVATVAFADPEVTDINDTRKKIASHIGIDPYHCVGSVRELNRKIFSASLSSCTCCFSCISVCKSDSE